MNRAVFKRCSVSLDTDTVRMCRELANAQSQSLSGIIRLALHEAYRRAVKKGRVTEAQSQ
jgi:hypothetical protein